MSKIKLYMMQTGIIKCKLNNIIMNANNAIDFDSPIPFFLITHPKGNVIIDGGLPVEVADNPRGYWGDICNVYLPILDSKDGCVNQVKKLGIEPASIRYVLQSHLHLDHTGAIGCFPNATHIVQRREYEYAHAPDWFASGGYIKRDFNKPNLKWQFLNAEADDYYDIFGDGTIISIFTPGHSVGHQSFLINLPDTGPVLLTADAAYTTEHWEEKALPGFLTSAIESVRSVQKLKMLADKTGAMIVTGHDPVAWKTFKKAPDYYG